MNYFSDRWHDLLPNLGDLVVAGLTQGAIYALIALGYTLVYGVLQLINFAHSEVFLVGTYASIIVWGWIGYAAGDGNPVPALGTVILLLGAGTIAASLVSGGTAVLIERVAYAPLRRKNAPRLIFLITAIGASVAISELVGELTNRRPWGVPLLVEPKTQFVIDPGMSINPAPVTNLQIGIVLSAIVMWFLLDTFLNRSRFGLGIRAVAQNEDTAALMGVNKDRVIMLTFLLGGLAAGVAATLYNLKIGTISFNIGFLLGLKAFTAAVLGGIGNLRGALVGGLVLGLVENLGAGFFGNKWIDVVAFVILVIVLMFRPTGILGDSLGRARA
ncbi:branched-chain amino acid ABC transporter permease [Actinorhabdospora filicis]|uniref:Branched-chain amino acid ABC transporter permease n=1 Tax=Actinorhabdospora filicis TaxID=1785913 RepID=A0A9W6WBR2_9ACTN|nr:branched-chain amino acid ABC transporter permease [Actinorhabdospora filicis]